ncbi:hypothetical protein FB45DRAFT_1040166 [Roridomyces roridus]|uniref:Uncharacterized protein n=1 Tax=Roridomyces roridus TaxID=1738132 RepID=A0AAD7B1S5_9AGAR|nr:hypothetical protein FB45DRAFT_1040166 [Roridomyces roridus]
MASKADAAATLFNFTCLSPSEPFSILQKLLWPTGDRPPGPFCMDPRVAVLGKSVGASYLLLHLLACGQPVFFVPEPQVIYYFFESGVQVSREPYESYYMGDGPTEDAVPESWVLLDVDAVQHPEWFPSFKLWVGLGVGLVYTALLDAGGKHWFTKQFVTDTRNVQPLSQEEMAALGCVSLADLFR